MLQLLAVSKPNTCSMQTSILKSNAKPDKIGFDKSHKLTYYMKQQLMSTGYKSSFEIQQCKNHRAATSVGPPINLNHRCSCCHEPISKSQISWCFRQQQICYLGEGTPMLLRFSLLSALIIIIAACVFSIFSLVQNSSGQYCSLKSRQCATGWEIKLSWINKLGQSSNLSLQTYVLCGCGLLFLILCEISRKIVYGVRVKIKETNQEDLYPQSFAILLKLDRAGNYSGKEIQQVLLQWLEVQLKINQQQAISPNERVIAKIYFHFNTELFSAICKKWYDLEQEQAKMERHFSIDQHQLSSRRSCKQIQHIINQIEEIKEKLRSKDLEKTNKCLVVFTSKYFAEFYLKNSNQALCSKQPNKLVLPEENYVKVEQAPFPNDVCYRHQHIPYKDKAKSRAFSWLLTIGTTAGLIGLEAVAVYFMNYLPANHPFSPYVSITFSASVILLSSLGTLVCRRLTEWERQPRQTHKQISNIYKFVVLVVSTRSWGLMLVFWLLKPNFASKNGNLVETLTWISIISFLLPHFFWIVNLRSLRSLMSMKKIESLCRDSKLVISQSRANEMYAKPNGQYDVNYSWIISTTFIACFCCPVVPLALPLAGVGLLMHYCCLRMMLAWVYRQPNPSNHYLFDKIFQLFSMAPTSFGVSNALIYFYSTHYLEQHKAQVLVLALNAVIILLPCFTLLVNSRRVEWHNYQKKDSDYTNVQSAFIHNYQEFNPIYELKINERERGESKVYTKSVILLQELNTMSRSLEETLKNKLFQKNTPNLNDLGKAEKEEEQEDQYFEYETKIQMPAPKPKKKSVPSLFKPSTEDKNIALQLRADRNGERREEKIELRKLFVCDEDEEDEKFKNALKNAIKISVTRIN